MIIIRDGKEIRLTLEEMREAHAIYDRFQKASKTRIRIIAQQHVDHFMTDHEYDVLIDHPEFLLAVAETYECPPFWCDNDDATIKFAVNKAKKEYM